MVAATAETCSVHLWNETVSSGGYSDSLHTPKPKCLSSPCEVPILVGRGILGKLIPEVPKFSIRSSNRGSMIHENFQIRGGVWRLIRLLCLYPSMWDGDLEERVCPEYCVARSHITALLCR